MNRIKNIVWKCTSKIDSRWDCNGYGNVEYLTDMPVSMRAWLVACKNKYGTYPPDFEYEAKVVPVAIQKHVESYCNDIYFVEDFGDGEIGVAA